MHVHVLPCVLHARITLRDPDCPGYACITLRDHLQLKVVDSTLPSGRYLGYCMHK